MAIQYNTMSSECYVRNICIMAAGLVRHVNLAAKQRSVPTRGHPCAQAKNQ